MFYEKGFIQSPQASIYSKVFIVDKSKQRLDELQLKFGDSIIPVLSDEANIEDLVSIEEPLEMVIRYKKKNKWIDDSISITMRTPKNDEDLIVGLLFCEGIVQKISEVEKIEFLGEKVGKFDLQNKIRACLLYTSDAADE